jgi:hypothetical protein
MEEKVTQAQKSIVILLRAYGEQDGSHNVLWTRKVVGLELAIAVPHPPLMASLSEHT